MHKATLAALLASVSALPVMAQENLSAADGEFIGTVTLGESRRGVQTDVAASETIITQDEIEDRQPGTVAELLDTIPNVNLLNGSTPQGAGISIRGLGNQAGTYGTDGKIAVVVDGVASGAEEIYRNGGSLALEPELYRKIRVTRGPSNGFRYSSGAIGGSIELETKDARDFLEEGDTFAFRGKAGYESNGDGNLFTGILAFRPVENFELLGFFGRRDIDARDDGGNNTLNNTDFSQRSHLIKGSYRFSDDLKLTFAHSHNEVPQFDTDYNAFSGVPSGFGTVDRYTEDQTSYVELAYDPVDNDLVNLTFRLQRKNEEIELTPRDNPFGPLGFTLLEANHLTETRSLRIDNLARFSLGSTNHNLTTGVEYSKRDRTSATDGGLNDASSLGGTDKSIAVYIVDEIEVNNSLTVTPQLRYETQTLEGKNNPVASAFGAPYVDANDVEFDKSALTGALSVKYDFTDNWAAFGTWAYNENLPPLDDLGTSFITQSERAETVEVGVSYDGLDVFTSNDTLKGKLTYFQTDIRNGTTYSGIDSIDLDGLELELSYAHPDFYVDFNAGRTRGEITEITAGSSFAKGDFFDHTPADAVQLTLGKRFLDNQLDANIEVSHAFSHDRTNQTSGARSPSESYTLVDLSMSYKPNQGVLKGTEWRASVENATDREFRRFGSSRNGTGRNFVFSIAKTF